MVMAEHVGREGVPSLRVLLARARHAGAKVEDKGSEVKVSFDDQRVVVSGTRKDGTPELLRLVRAAEAANPPAPRPKARPLSVAEAAAAVDLSDPATRGPDPVPTIADRIRTYLRDTETPDADGWRPYSSRAIADALGLSVNQVSTWLSMQGPKYRKHPALDVRYQGKRPVAIRFAVDTRSGKPAPAPVVEPTAVPVRDYRDQPLRPVQERFDLPDRPAGPAPLGTLPTPKLAEYAEARRIAKASPMLRVDVSDADVDEILSEAAKLYFWIRSGRRE